MFKFVIISKRLMFEQRFCDFHKKCRKFIDKHFYCDNESGTEASFCPWNHRFTVNSVVKRFTIIDFKSIGFFLLDFIINSAIRSKKVYTRNRPNGNCSTFYRVFHSMKYDSSCLFPRSTSCYKCEKYNFLFFRILFSLFVFFILSEIN